MISPILMVIGIFLFIVGNILMTETTSKPITIIGFIMMLAAVFVWVLGVNYYFMW